jgi:hypothetical protein
LPFMMVARLPAWALDEQFTDTLHDAVTSNGNGKEIDIERYTSATVTIIISAGTATVTLNVTENGTTWINRTCTSTSDTSGVLTATATATDIFQCSISGMKKLRAPVTDCTGCTVTVRVRVTTAVMGKGGGGGGGPASSIVSSATLPATCSQGQVYFDTDATSGQRFYVCDSTDTWVAPLTIESDTLATVGARGRTDGGSINQSTAYLIGSTAADSFHAFYYDVTDGLVYTCKVSGTFGNCDRIIKLNAGKTFKIRNSAGTIGFQHDEATNKVTILSGAQLDDQVWVADSATSGTLRTLPDCTDAAGNHLNYTQSTNAFSCGTSASGFETIVRKTADETVNNSITLQDDDQLLFAVEANSFYIFTLFVTYNSSTVADWKWNFSVPASTTGRRKSDVLASGATSCGGSTTLASNVITQEVNSIGGTASDCENVITGQVATSGTAGNVTFRWAQNTAEVSNTIVRANSYLTWRKL